MVGLRMSDPLQAAINQVLLDPDAPVSNTSEAIRFILRDWLISHGYLKDDE